MRLGLGLGLQQRRPATAAPAGFPEWLPQAVSGDRPLVYADLANGRYWASGAETTFSGLFEEFPDWGPFEGLTSGQGLGGANNAVSLVNPLGADLIAAGYTLVSEFAASGALSGAFTFALIQEPEWDPEYDFNVRPSSGPTALSNLSLSSGTTVQNPAQGPWADGVHKSACTFDDGAFVASDDGSAVYTNEDLAPVAPVTRMILGPNGLSGDAYLTSVAFYSKQPQADLPALTDIGLGGVNIGGFPHSSATPPDPATLWSADFANGVYLLDGAASTLEAMFAEDLNYAGWDPATNVHPGQGAFFCGPVATPELLALMLGGATFVITGTPTTQTVGQFVGAVNFANGFDVWDQDCDLHLSVSEVAGELGNPSDSDAVEGPGLPDLAPFKIAATLRGNRVAFSLNGGEVLSVGPIGGDWADMTAWGIDCSRFYLAQLDCLTWRDDAELPALSAAGSGDLLTYNGDGVTYLGAPVTYTT